MDDDKKRPSENFDSPEAPNETNHIITISKSTEPQDSKSSDTKKKNTPNDNSVTSYSSLSSQVPSNDVEKPKMFDLNEEISPVTTRRKTVAKATANTIEDTYSTVLDELQNRLQKNNILTKKVVAATLEKTGFSPDTIEVITEAFEVINKLITSLEIQKSTKLLITKSASQKLTSLKKEIPKKALQDLNAFLEEVLSAADELAEQLKKTGVNYIVNPEKKHSLNQEGLRKFKKIISVYEKSSGQARQFLSDFFEGRGQVVQDIPIDRKDFKKNGDIINKVSLGDDSVLTRIDRDIFSRNIEKTYQDVVEQDIELQQLDAFTESLNSKSDNKQIFRILLSLINLHLIRLRDMSSQFTNIVNEAIKDNYQRPQDEFEKEDFEADTKTISAGILRMLRATQITELLKRYLK